MSFISHVSLLVDDYDAAIAFFCDVCEFELVEDRATAGTDGAQKRWVVVKPVGSQTGLVLALASTPEQSERVGNQLGGRVGFFLDTDDFERAHARMIAAGVSFREAPRYEPYGTVAVWEDPWGNAWDLIQRSS